MRFCFPITWVDYINKIFYFAFFCVYKKYTGKEMLSLPFNWTSEFIEPIFPIFGKQKFL